MNKTAVDVDAAPLAEVSSIIKQNREALKKSTTTGDRQPLVVSGPSGAGKGTLIKKLTEKHPGKFGFSVSYATRAPREGEIDGEHYNFVAKEKFEEMIKNDEFIEYCEVHSNYYGTAK